MILFLGRVGEEGALVRNCNKRPRHVTLRMPRQYLITHHLHEDM